MSSAAPSSFPLMDKENFSFPHDFPYEFASPYSTESESEDEDITGLTRRFSRSASLKEPLYNFKEKRFFSGSPEPTLGWSGCVPTQVPSPPPFAKSDEDAWNLIYAAAARVARLKMKTDITGASVGVVAYNNTRGLLGALRPFTHPHSTPWGIAGGKEFFRQQQLCRNRDVYGDYNCSGGGGCGGRGAPPPSFPQSAWPPPHLQNQNRQNQHKAVVLGGPDGVGMPAKRECAGTGVFLPRSYCNNPPESRKGQECSIPRLPSRTPPPIQARINGGFIPNYEMLMGRRDAMIQRRSNIHGGVKVSPAKNPEMLLPSEWTY